MNKIHDCLKMLNQINKIDKLGGRDSLFGLMEIFEIYLEEEHAKDNETGMYRFKGMEQYGNIVSLQRSNDAMRRCLDELHFTKNEFEQLMSWYKGRNSIDTITLGLYIKWFIKDNLNG